ncbi:MAG: DUF72 domain-containing protein [Candidatus Thermoplasmatota archaeon]|nr:DUF72 domain-containing protein [Candidatus Thermoplasmatota archaeon]
MIFLGCSGWSYRDWEGSFYPASSKDKLAYYASRFHSVEINSTFYMIPAERMLSSWVQKAKNFHGFRFSVKLPRDLSHDLVLRNAEAAGHFAQSFEASVLEIIHRSGSLGSVLLQLPPFFGARRKENLLKLLSMMDTSRYMYAVEVRNVDLYNDADLAESLLEKNVTMVDIDSPEKPMDTISSQTRMVYIRLHGHNSAEWSNPNSDGMERYLYSYSDAELMTIADKILAAASRYRDLYVYFNNHPQGNAPRNASSLANMLGMPGAGRSRTLSEY